MMMSIKCNHTINYITKNMHSMKFNTCLSKLMEFVNHFFDIGLPDKYKEIFILLISPFAPHLGEEMWSIIGKKGSIFNENWPLVDESKLVQSIFKIAVQVNGKVRSVIEVNDTANKEKLDIAKQNNNIQKYLNGKEIKKILFRKNNKFCSILNI